MELFQYQNLWFGYIGALVVLGISGYLIIKPIPVIWIRWNLLVAIMVFLAAPIQIEDHWMVPSALYFIFEHFFVGNPLAIEVLYQLLQHVGVAIIATSLMILSIRLINRPPSS